MPAQHNLWLCFVRFFGVEEKNKDSFLILDFYKNSNLIYLYHAKNACTNTMKVVGGFLEQELELEICASIANASQFSNNRDSHINIKHIHLQLPDKKLQRVTYQKTAFFAPDNHYSRKNVTLAFIPFRGLVTAS